MDPRRPGYNSDIAKRKPSTSPPNGAPAKVQKTVNGKIHLETGGGFGATSPKGGPAPPAPMAPGSLVDLLVAFGNQCSTVASTNVNQKQAKTALDRANTEFQKMSEHFQAFPQIKEQKTAAQSKAEKSFKAADAELEQQRYAQKHLATSIAALLQQSQPSASTSDPTSAELKQVEQKCIDLEKRLGNLNYVSSDEMQRIDDKCNVLKTTVAELSELVEESKYAESRVKDLHRKYDQTEKDLKAIEGRLSSLRNQVAGDSGDSLKEKVISLMARAETPKITSGTVDKLDTWTAQEIETRLQHEKDLAQDENQKRDIAIAQYVEGEIKAVNEKISAMSQQITAISGARGHDVALFNALKDDVKSDISEVKEKLAAVEDRTKDYERTKSAVFDQAREISNLKGEVSTKVDRNFVAGAVKVARDQGAVQPPSRTPTPGTVLHGSSNGTMTSQINGFYPQLDPNGQPHAGSVSHPSSLETDKKIAALEEMTAMLSYVTNRLQTQYNNLTTETVCQAMLDQLGEVWPHAKNWEGWVNELKGRQAEFDRQREDLKAAVTRLGIDAGTALKAVTDAKTTAKEAQESSATATRMAQKAVTASAKATQIAQEAKESSATIVQQTADQAKSLARQHANACEKLREEHEGVVRQVSDLKSRGRKELIELNGKVNTIATEISRAKGTFEAWEESRSRR